MTTPAYVARYVVPAAYALLPPKMQSLKATTLLMAIGFHESKFRYRRQTPSGPARGFLQFERGGGVTGVMTHRTSAAIIAGVLRVLCYPVTVAAAYAAIRDNDVLALCFGRLLLWTDPQPLPEIGQIEMAYRCYDRNWRPGAKRPLDWPQAYAEAIAIVAAETWQDDHLGD